MTHRAIQRAVIKMLYDPAFAERVRTDPHALKNLPLDIQRQLSSLDPRVLGVDRLRRQRILRALFDELKGTITVALAETKRFAFLESFFASPQFHQMIDQRGRAVFAVIDYVCESTLCTPALRPLARLERTLAESRRDRRTPGRPYTHGASRLRLAPGIRPLRSTMGATQALNAVEQYLFEVGHLPAVAQCDDAPTLSLPPYDPSPTYLVTVPLAEKVTLVAVDEATVSLLEAVRDRAPVRDSPLLSYLGESELIEVDSGE